MKWVNEPSEDMYKTKCWTGDCPGKSGGCVQNNILCPVNFCASRVCSALVCVLYSGS